jgi:hypothetical protein
MAPTSDVAVQPAPGISRGGFLARLGATIVGLTAADILATQKAAWANIYCCTPYNSCGSYGCTCPNPGSGGCCWYCSDPNNCNTYQCCDRTCGGHNCICAFYICHCGC